MRTLRETFGRLRRPRSDLERLLGMRCRDLSLYETALRHRSALREAPAERLESNERLEFLGDAVLGFVVAELLYERFPGKPEGFLTPLRSKLVNGRALAARAHSLGLGRLIRMSENMERTGGRDNATVLADAFEAVIGALFLDRGAAAARRFIRRTVVDATDLDRLASEEDNYKSALLEFAQAKGWQQPLYHVTEVRGPSHERVFTVEVSIADTPLGTGVGGSKKDAEKQAARRALAQLGPPGAERNVTVEVESANAAP